MVLGLLQRRLPLAAGFLQPIKRRPKHEELSLVCCLLSPLGAGAAGARSYLALAIAVAGWNVLGQISFDLGSPAAAQGSGMLAALPGNAAQCTAGQRLRSFCHVAKRDNANQSLLPVHNGQP